MGKNVKRFKTDYPGVFYREAKRISGNGMERVYYIVFKKNGKFYEEKAGRQYADRMTPARASLYRSERIDGKRPSRKEIREAEKEAKEAEKNRWTIERLWEEYLSRRPDLKGVGADRSRFNKYLKPRFGTKEPHELSPFDVDTLRVSMLKKASKQHAKNVLALLRRVVNFGAEKGLCQPLSFKIEMPKNVNSLKTEDLTTKQLGNLFKAIEKDTHHQAGNMMKMALFTGMRRGEMFKLKWTDIDFKNGFIHLRDPKGGQDQKIPLNDEARQLLESIPRTKSLFVFPGREGKQRKEIHKHTRNIADEAGLPKDFRPLHGLRHVYASMLASSGKVDLYTLQKLLTHKDPKMTQRYAHLRDEALKKAGSLAGDLIKEAIEGEKNNETDAGEPEASGKVFNLEQKKIEN